MWRCTLRTSSILVAGLLAAPTLAASPPAHRIRDLNETPVGNALIGEMSSFDGAAIFTSWGEAPGPFGWPYQVWRTDGTTDGTRSILEANIKGSGVVLGANFVFLGYTNQCGDGLYSTDGTESGTTILRSFCDVYGYTSSLTKVGERAFFAVESVVLGHQLWTTDGTREGTRLVFSFGNVPFVPGDLAALGSVLLFMGHDDVHGYELWRSDGTPGGTYMVADLRTGPKGSEPNGFLSYGGVLYFSATDEEHGRERWRSDGTLAGTTLFRDHSPGPQSSDSYLLGVFQDVLYLGADAPESGVELWRTDGTAEGTALLADIAAGVTSSYPWIFDALGSALVVSAETPNFGRELWRVDSSTGAAEMLRDICPGPDGSEIRRTVRLGDVVYFRANDGIHGSELWRSDGTTQGTYLLADILPGPGGSGGFAGTDAPLIALDGQIVLAADDGVHGYELFAVDASTGATRLVRDLLPWTASSGRWPTFVDFGGVAYFGADDGVHGSELWRTDGTPAGTAMVADLVPGDGSSEPAEIATIGDRMVFSAGSSLWSLRAGSDEVTWLDDRARYLTVAGDAIWYTGHQPSFGWQLFKTDGTPEGTHFAVVLGDSDRDSQGARPRYLHAAFDGLICSARGFLSSGSEPWYVPGDGTGALPLADIAPGPLDSWSSGYFSRPGVSGVWFSARDGVHGPELWRVDESLEPYLVKDIWPGASGSDSSVLHVWPDGRALVRASDPENGCELWASDGTPEGTALIRDIAPETWWSDAWRGPCPGDSAPSNEIVYFSADDGIHGEELWRTDGTSEGTFLVADIERGPEGSTPVGLVSVDGRIVFAATTRAHGRELWVTDGTTSGTRLFQDIRPGPASGNPVGFSTVGERVLFQAFDDEAGYEPWSFKRCRLPGADTLVPEGAITAPDAGACFGPKAVPVVVEDTFADRCDDDILRTYVPEGGPSYSAHGDVALTLEAVDSAGNTARDARSFTIDLVPPTVTLAPPPPLPKSLPASVPFSLIWTAGDDDGASKGVLREKVFLDGCLLWDGLAYGDDDGLLSDETLVLGRDQLCTLARACGVTELRNPVVRVEAVDCGENAGSASATVAGAYLIPKAMCSR